MSECRGIRRQNRATQSVMKFGKPSISWPMLTPLLIMFVGFTLLFVALVLVRVRGEILRRERQARWVAEVVTV